MRYEKLTDIIHDPNFSQFAAILHTATRPGWRMKHAAFPTVNVTIERLFKLLTRTTAGWPQMIKRDFLTEWTKLFTGLVEEDPKLFYTVENQNWFTSVYGGDESEAKLIFSMLFTVAMARQEIYTAEQLEEITGVAAGTWRNRAARGEVVGANKAGKTWIFNSLALRAYGTETGDAPVQIETEESED